MLIHEPGGEVLIEYKIAQFPRFKITI